MGCTPTWSERVDLALGGEQPFDLHRELREHLKGCPACRADYDRVADGLARLERRFPSPCESAAAHGEAALLAALTPAQPVVRRSPRWARIGIVSGTLALAAGLTLALLPSRPTTAPDELASRGGALASASSLRLFCLDDAHQVQADSAAGPLSCPASQPIQVALTTSAPRYAALIAQDQRGALRVIWPKGERAQAVAVGEAQLLPGAFRLKPGTTAMVALFGEHTFSLSTLHLAEGLPALKRLGLEYAEVSLRGPTP